MPVEGHAYEWQTLRVTVSRVEIEIVGAIALASAVRTNGERTVIILRHGLLPARTPMRRARRHRMRFDRRCSVAAHGNKGAADEAQACMVEVIAVEFINCGEKPAAPHKLFKYLVLEEECHFAACLIRIISA